MVIWGNSFASEIDAQWCLRNRDQREKDRRMKECLRLTEKYPLSLARNILAGETEKR